MWVRASTQIISLLALFSSTAALAREDGAREDHALQSEWPLSSREKPRTARKAPSDRREEAAHRSGSAAGGLFNTRRHHHHRRLRWHDRHPATNSDLLGGTRQVLERGGAASSLGATLADTVIPVATDRRRVHEEILRCKTALTGAQERIRRGDDEDSKEEEEDETKGGESGGGRGGRRAARRRSPPRPERRVNVKLLAGVTDSVGDSIVQIASYMNEAGAHAAKDELDDATLGGFTAQAVAASTDGDSVSREISRDQPRSAEISRDQPRSADLPARACAAMLPLHRKKICVTYASPRSRSWHS